MSALRVGLSATLLERDPALATKLAQLGRARARQISWDECARNTLDVYCKVI